MKINENCLPCLVNQVVKVAEMTNADRREELYQKVFQYLGRMDFSKTNPEIIGATFRLLREHLGNDDPYREIREYYNRLFLDMTDEFTAQINASPHPFEEAVKYAILGNIIDFNPMHNSGLNEILAFFDRNRDRPLTINHSKELIEDILRGRTLLYLGDNCGEICLDKILIQKIRKVRPDLEIFFAVRGKPVVNDSIEADACAVGMDSVAKIISNGDDSLGTVLSRTSEAFNAVYRAADVVIAKGQANYESLSEEKGKKIYFMLMTKCEVIASDIGVPQKSMICMRSGARTAPASSTA